MDSMNTLIEYKEYIKKVKKNSSVNDYLLMIEELYNDNLIKEKYKFSFFEFPKLSILAIKESNNYFSEIYNLLSAYNRIFNEKQLKEKYLRVYYQIYYCFFCMVEKLKKEEIIKIEEKDLHRFQKKWLIICFNSSADRTLKYWLEESQEINPKGTIDIEKNIEEILFDKEKLIKEFTRENNLEFYTSRAIDWYLERYNREIAVKIFNEFYTDGNKNCFDTIKLWYPRLLVAILIGIFSLSTIDNIWNFPHKSFGILILSCLFFFSFSFFYLTYECYNIIHNEEKACKRAFKVGWRGFIVSISASTIICGIKTIINPEYGINIWKNILFFASAALPIGIIIQVFWDEKNITEPLE